MAESTQDALRLSWVGGVEDRLCAREQAKAWALREVWKDDEKSLWGLNEYVASKLRKTKKGQPKGEHPSAACIGQLFEKMDSDPDWYPGKHNGERRGPKRIITGGKKSAIVAAAKRIKREDGEPTYSAIVAACPQATLNPNTGEAVDPKLIYTVFREACYDEDPSDLWSHMSRLSRGALDEKAMQKRWAFAKHMKTLGKTPQWYYKRLVWCDICNSLLPTTHRKARDMALARKGNKGWMSKGSQQHSQNLRGPKHVLKMGGKDTVKVWWMPILTRGKLHIEPLPDNFPGDTEEGAEIMVAKVRAALNIRFQGGDPPVVLFTDRGNGFYEAGSGAITESYRQALRAHGLKAFFGNDASIQPGQLQEVMLHETAVSWMRERLKRTLPKKSWEETVEAYRSRLKACAAYINGKHDVEGLCLELPERVAELDKRKGDRLAK